MINYLSDKDFLSKINTIKERTVYARIQALNYNHEIVETIEGKCTGGSLSIDGKSALRRSCSSLTLLTNLNTKITDYLWAFKNLFKVEIGLENNIEPKYPSIVWFPQGTFVITSFSKSLTTNNFTVSISGQDKMCRLNGSIGGNLPSEVDFGTIEEIDENENIEIKKVPLYTIIQQAVHEYGQEPLHNIIINDLDEHGLELWEYRGDTPLYMFYQAPGAGNSGKILGMTLDDVNVYKDGAIIKVSDSTLTYYSMNTLDENINVTASEVYLKEGTDNNYKCYIIKLEFGEIAGYHQTDLVYAGDLILKAGENLVSLLDKITNMLGEFEYFYDIEGRFIFQKKKTYIQELFSPINGEIVNPIMATLPYEKYFEDLTYFTNFSETPAIKDVRNDFSVWGTMQSISGASLPIHVRYSIAKKPEKYKLSWPICQKQDLYYAYGKAPEENEDYYYIVIDNNTIKEKSQATENELNNTSNTKYISISFVKKQQSDSNDLLGIWEEIEEGTWKKSAENYCNKNGGSLENETDLNYYYKLIYGIGEEFTIDEYDWREILYLMAYEHQHHNAENDFLSKIKENNPWITGEATGYESYYSEMLGFWRQLYNPYPLAKEKDKFFAENEIKKYWSKDIHLNPQGIIFWIEFLDIGEVSLGQFSIEKVGMRNKVENHSASTSIFLNKTPEVIFITDSENFDNTQFSAYSPLWIQENAKDLFSISSQGISLTEKVNNLIYQYACCAESVSITSIPMYDLQPNTRIRIKDYGDYIIDKITLSLTYNGTMGLTCIKVVDSIY